MFAITEICLAVTALVLTAIGLGVTIYTTFSNKTKSSTEAWADYLARVGSPTSGSTLEGFVQGSINAIGGVAKVALPVIGVVSSLPTVITTALGVSGVFGIIGTLIATATGNAGLAALGVVLLLLLTTTARKKPKKKLYVPAASATDESKRTQIAREKLDNSSPTE